MSNLKQREKLLRQAKIETGTLRTLVRSRTLLKQNRWFNQDQRKGDICAQMAISEAAVTLAATLQSERREIVELAMNLILKEAQAIPPCVLNDGYIGIGKQWVSIPHWNDAQRYKKDVVKVFDTTINNLRKKLQPV